MKVLTISGGVYVPDILYLINHLYNNGPDTDHGQGNQIFDNVYVDYMYIESGGAPPVPDTMHVFSIDVIRVAGKGNKYRGQAVVVVHDQNDQPVSGALVSGHFSGPSSDNASGSTVGDGSATIQSQQVRNPSGDWCFTVDDISLGSNVYNAAANVETSDCEGGAAKLATLGLPLSFELYQNNPNPFNPITKIAFSLPIATHTTLEIFNIRGQKVTTLVDESMNAGFHSVSWDGSAAASGIYFYRIQAGEFTSTKKMVLAK